MKNWQYLLSKISPHKICQLETDIKRLNDELFQQKVHLDNLNQVKL